jgi:hypothetical protein
MGSRNKSNDALCVTGLGPLPAFTAPQQQWPVHLSQEMYSDGSIEAQLPQGTLRFGSITELRIALSRTHSTAPATLIAKA